MEKKVLAICLIAGFLGLLCAALAFAAEAKRKKVPPPVTFLFFSSSAPFCFFFFLIRLLFEFFLPLNKVDPYMQYNSAKN